MRIAIYARVSSETQAQEKTIRSQLEALRTHAAANGMHVVAECLDDGYSGTSLERPGLDRVRDLAAAGMIDAALILTPDRLTRKNGHLFILQEEFDKRNVKLVFADHPLTDSPQGQLLFSVQGVIAEYERTMILDRTRRGRMHHARQGHPGGGNVPYGYRRINKTKDSPARWEIDPGEAEIVRLVYDLAVNKRFSLRRIARHLTDNGYQTRSGTCHWKTGVIGRILQAEAYCGTTHSYMVRVVEPIRPRLSRTYRRRKNSLAVPRPREDWIPIPVPPIITRELWEAAKTQLALNASLSPRHNWKNNYLLRTLLTCGLCGSRMAGHARGNRVVYECTPSAHRATAPRHDDQRVAVPRDLLESRVWDSLVDLATNSDRLRAVLAERAHAAQPKDDASRNMLADNDKALEKLRLEEERVLDAYRAQVLTLDQLKMQLTKVQLKKSRLIDERKALLARQEGPQAANIASLDLNAIASRLKRAMARADFATRQRIVQVLLNSIILYPDRAVVSGVLPLDGNIPDDPGLWRLPSAPVSG
jgi:site-specific DNA recombinase